MAASLFGVGNVINLDAQGTLMEESFVATAGQLIFDLTSFSYAMGSGSIKVFVNGQKQRLGYDYTETTSTRFTWLSGDLAAGDRVDVIGFPEIDLSNNIDPTIRSQLASTASPSDGAGMVGFKQAGTGAVARTAQDKMREVVSLKDVGAVGDGVTNDKAAIDLKNTNGTVVFLAGATYAYTGTFVPVAKFVDGTIIDSNRSWDFSTRTTESNARIIQGRGRLNYNTPNSVSVCVPENIVMAGFRFMGSYKKGQGRVMPSGATSGKVVVNDSTNLAIESSIKSENWYAVFAVCNNSSSAVSYVNMPFFRAGTPSGSVIPFAAGGESSGDTITTITYSGLATDELVGSEVLVIQEGKVFSGRTTAVTANTNGNITLASPGSIAANDFFLVAPPGWDHYVYLGSWYRDTGEPRNMADTGSLVGSYGVDLVGLPATGAVSLTRFPCAGQVSPLATAALYQLTYTLSTASTGVAAHYVYMDSSTHYTSSFYNQKTSGSSETYQSAVSKMPFSSEQALWINTAGSLAASVTGRTMRLYGWVEP